jgi:hypothetical protein
MRVSNAIPVSTFLPVHTLNYVQTLKASLNPSKGKGNPSKGKGKSKNKKSQLPDSPAAHLATTTTSTEDVALTAAASIGVGGTEGSELITAGIPGFTSSDSSPCISHSNQSSGSTTSTPGSGITTNTNTNTPSNIAHKLDEPQLASTSATGVEHAPNAGGADGSEPASLTRADGSTEAVP